MIIETERLILRPYRVADATAVHSYASDPEVCRYTDFGPNTWDETLGFLQQVTDPAAIRTDLAITLKPDDAVVGGIGGEMKRLGHFEVGWVLHPDFWGKGIATEAARGFIDRMVSLGGISTVFARSRPENAASMRIMDKLGMTFVELIPHDKVVRGETVDSRVYAMDV